MTYLSRDAAHLAALQRARRANKVRMDYMPSPEAQAAIEARRGGLVPGSRHATNSAVLDAIVCEWAKATGINYRLKSMPMTSGASPELIDSTRARMSSATAKNSGLQRVQCGARRHRDGQPCEAMSELGKRRCRFHGGRSTGPRTSEGRARALANLKRGPTRQGTSG